MPQQHVFDAHRHPGALPAFPFYGGPPVNPDTTARATIAQLISDLDAEGTDRALVLPNYGVPDPDIAFSFNELVVEAANTDDRIRAALWVSPKPADADRTAKALALAGEPRVRALKMSFLLGGRVTVSGHIKLIGSRFFDWVAAGNASTLTCPGPSDSPRTGWSARSTGAGWATTGSCSPAISPGEISLAS